MTINIPQLNSICGCSLKTATITIGILQLIILLLYIADVVIYSISYLRYYERMRYDQIYADILFEQSVFIQMLFSLLLLYGTIKEKSSFVMAWLMFGIALIIEYIWNIIWYLTNYMHGPYMFEDILALVLESIAMLVVYNYYRTLSKDDYVLYN